MPPLLSTAETAAPSMTRPFATKSSPAEASEIHTDDAQSSAEEGQDVPKGKKVKKEKKLIKAPPVMHIPKSMLSKKLLRKNVQQRCNLLTAPGEIILAILKCGVLDPFDVACLMLTCKELASVVDNLNIALTLKRQLKSGKEYERMMEYGNSEIELTELSGMELTAEEYYAMKSQLEKKFEGRVEAEDMNDFLRRLDRGWNQSKSRLCSKCNIFRPTGKNHWNKKVQKYLYRSNSPAARGYRIMEDCRCGCNPKDLIDNWIKHQTDLNKIMCCPECDFSETKPGPPDCERCADLSMMDLEMAMDYMESGCGCVGCDCRLCGCRRM